MGEPTDPTRPAEVVEGETTALAVADVGVHFVTTVDEARTRVEQLQEFIGAVMVPGVDYRTIPGTPKPTLFKPGAEKLCEIYGLASLFEVVNRIEDWDEGFFHYETKCRLVSQRTGVVVAEGLGSCNSRERRFRNQDVFTVVNTILKMSKKRAHVDAALSATRSSGIFTQDLEDVDLAFGRRRPAPSAPRPAPIPRRAPSRSDLASGWTRLVERGRAVGIVVEPLDPSWDDAEVLRRGAEWKETIAAIDESERLARPAG